MKKIPLYNIIKLMCISLLLIPIGCEKAFDEALKRAADSRETLEGVLDDRDKVLGMLSSCYIGLPWHRLQIFYWATFEVLTDNAFEFNTRGEVDQWRSGALSPDYSVVSVNQNANNQYSNNKQGSFWGRYWGGHPPVQPPD